MPVSRLKQAGDTIIEVLIAMTAVSMVLGAAFVTVNRSVITGRQAQEHVEALKLAESQIEGLKKFAYLEDTTNANYIFGTIPVPLPFCISIDTSTSPATFILRQFTAPIAANARNDNFQTATTPYPPDCVKGFYRISVTPALASDTTHTFTIRVRWDAASGRGRDEVKLLYRIHPGQE
jgi:Tfp pilus assembly protein PilV